MANTYNKKPYKGKKMLANKSYKGSATSVKSTNKAHYKASPTATKKPPQTVGAVSKNKDMQVKEDFPHFRKYLKSGHPALIVGEKLSEQKKEEYKYRKVMHGERDGKRLNEKVCPNPNKNDTEPMYVGKRVRADEKKYFGSRMPWKYPKK